MNAEAIAATAAELFNHAYERMVLGALMSDASAIDALELTAGDFHRPAHIAVYNAIRSAHDAGEPTEPNALAVRLGAGKPLTGAAAVDLAEIYAEAALPGQVAWYARHLRDLTDRRGVLAGTAQVAAAAAAGATAEQLHEMAERVAATARPRTGLDQAMTSLGEFIGQGLDDIENRSQHQTSLATGYADLDRLLGGGMRAGQLAIVGARPGMGKTVLALDIARHAAIRHKRPVAYFSMEMSTQELFDRLLAAYANLPYSAVREGKLNQDQWEMATTAAGPMGQSPLYLITDFSLTLAKLRNRARKIEHLAGALDLVIVDYIQLIKAEGRHDTREQLVGSVVRACKELAGELGCPVLALAQLNRNSQARPDKSPQMADLRESGELEQAADIVVLLHRDDYYDHESPRAGEVDLLVEKNRNGANGSVTLAAQLHLARFANMAQG